jgi:hypothetical protein
MRDGQIVQSGKYNDLLASGLDFGALVAAHETSMELLEVSAEIPSENSPTPPKFSQGLSKIGEENDENKLLDQPKSDKGNSKLIEEEERATGNVGLHVYKQYCTEAFGWWGAVVALLLSLVWQASLMAGDYWLAFETADERAATFKPSLFISVYGIIAAVSVVFLIMRSLFFTLMGLKTAQIFFGGILRSILHAPMSFFDTTPSGRILSRVRVQDPTMIFFPIVCAFNYDCIPPEIYSRILDKDA